MKSDDLISNSYNYSEYWLYYVVMELQRTVISFTKHFKYWFLYTSPHSQVHTASGRNTKYRSVWSLSGPICRNVLRCLLCSYGTVQDLLTPVMLQTNRFFKWDYEATFFVSDHQHKAFSIPSLNSHGKLTAVRHNGLNMYHLLCHISYKEMLHHLFRHDSIFGFPVCRQM